MYKIVTVFLILYLLPPQSQQHRFTRCGIAENKVFGTTVVVGRFVRQTAVRLCSIAVTKNGKQQHDADKNKDTG